MYFLTPYFIHTIAQIYFTGGDFNSVINRLWGETTEEVGNIRWHSWLRLKILHLRSPPSIPSSNIHGKRAPYYAFQIKRPYF